ncbi:hypothetical protein [Streptomyces sp. NPDC059092]|uniref:hypothetical protein n=1 Tax=Streptomyces sp. NPDC059092 TaxID=3346725 RepID=UPI0036AE453A
MRTGPNRASAATPARSSWPATARTSYGTRSRAVTGTWLSPYDNRRLTAASQLDVDHIGMAEGSGARGVPTRVVGVSRKEKERLVNQMATGYDPLWTPVVIEVPLRDSDKVVLIVRIERDLVPAPIVTDGNAIWAGKEHEERRNDRDPLDFCLHNSGTLSGTHRPAHRQAEGDRDTPAAPSRGTSSPARSGPPAMR